MLTIGQAIDAMIAGERVECTSAPKAPELVGYIVWRHKTTWSIRSPKGQKHEGLIHMPMLREAMSGPVVFEILHES